MSLFLLNVVWTIGLLFLLGSGDMLFHLTGETHSISQHALALPFLFLMGSMISEVWAKNKAAGMAMCGLLGVGLIGGFCDGVPGLPGKLNCAVALFLFRINK